MKQSNSEITKVLKYFSLFAYHPTLEEIYTFFPKKISKEELKYTLPQYGKKISNIKYKISKRKLNNPRFRVYIKLLSLFPQIKLVGLSGSISMMNAKIDDDIDLFIITAKSRLFTGRFLAMFFAYIMGLKRELGQSKAPNKVCLNLFFNEKNMAVPKNKQTIYVGHEVLQMKPIVVKDNIYQKFLEANKWVFKLFPNAKLVFSMKYKVSSMKKIQDTKYSILDTIPDKIEQVLKNFQLTLINRHRTTELISSSQLWFHPQDFEKKVKE